MKNGGRLLLREAQGTDAGAVLAYLNRVGGESDNLLFGKDGFPLPVEREGLLNAPLCDGHKWPMEQILEAIPRGTLVLGGQVSAPLKKLGEKQGLRLVDYGAREDFLCRNAAITAEGALQLAMGHHQESLGDTRCLVLGYGRCG